MSSKIVYQVSTPDQVISAFVHMGVSYSMWARVTGRDDVYIPSLIGTRPGAGGMEINAGEWQTVSDQVPSADTAGRMVTRHRVEYKNDEWLVPELIYVIHQCEGCHYPPNMCCLQGIAEEYYDDAADELYSTGLSFPVITID